MSQPRVTPWSCWRRATSTTRVAGHLLVETPIARHPLAAGVSYKKGAGRLAAGPFICMAPRRIGPDAPSSRWKLLDRSDHHSSDVRGRTGHLARLPPADRSQRVCDQLLCDPE